MSVILSEFPLERIESALHEAGSFAPFDARGHCQCRTVTKLKQKSVSNCGPHPTSGVRTDQSGPMDACVRQKVTLPFEFILKSEPSRSRKWFWRCNQATRGVPHPRIRCSSGAHVALMWRSWQSRLAVDRQRRSTSRLVARRPGCRHPCGAPWSSGPCRARPVQTRRGQAPVRSCRSN